MKNRKITIENGVVYIPEEARMNMSEIAELFGIGYPMAKKSVRAIEKSGIASGDYAMCCIVEKMKVYPEYYGLEMIVAVAFWIKSRNAGLFREWLLRKVYKTEIPEMLILSIQNPMLN